MRSYPVASRLGDALGVEPTKMSIVCMLGASAGFILPYSYQTNLMVFAGALHTHPVPNTCTTQLLDIPR